MHGHAHRDEKQKGTPQVFWPVKISLPVWHFLSCRHTPTLPTPFYTWASVLLSKETYINQVCQDTRLKKAAKSELSVLSPSIAGDNLTAFSITSCSFAWYLVCRPVHFWHFMKGNSGVGVSSSTLQKLESTFPWFDTTNTLQQHHQSICCPVSV